MEWVTAGKDQHICLSASCIERQTTLNSHGTLEDDRWVQGGGKETQSLNSASPRPAPPRLLPPVEDGED